MAEISVQRTEVVDVSSTKNFTPDRKRFQPATAGPALALDAEGNIQNLTPAARRLLEYQPRDTVETCFFSHVHGKNLYRVMRDIADMVCYGKSSASWLLRLRTGRGRWRWYQATVENRLGRADGCIVVKLRDLHEW